VVERCLALCLITRGHVDHSLSKNHGFLENVLNLTACRRAFHVMNVLYNIYLHMKICPQVLGTGCGEVVFFFVMFSRLVRSFFPQVCGSRKKALPTTAAVRG